MRPPQDLSKKEYGSWTVVDGALPFTGLAGRKVMCRCACGLRKLVSVRDLKAGTSTKCRRCAKAELAASNRAAGELRRAEKAAKPVTPVERDRPENYRQWSPAEKKTQTHCIHGHEFTPDNTKIKAGTRKCRACEKIWNHARPSRAVV